MGCGRFYGWEGGSWDLGCRSSVLEFVFVFRISIVFLSVLRIFLMRRYVSRGLNKVA